MRKGTPCTRSAGRTAERKAVSSPATPTLTTTSTVDPRAALGEKERQGGSRRPRPAAPAEPQGPPAEPGPRPRLREHYEERVRVKLAQQFGLANPHEVPKLVKIVLNVGMGDAP